VKIFCQDLKLARIKGMRRICETVDVGGGSQRANCELKYLCFKKTGVAIDNIAHTKYWEYADMVRAMR
jgi:hypothetical protein